MSSTLTAEKKTGSRKQIESLVNVDKLLPNFSFNIRQKNWFIIPVVCLFIHFVVSFVYRFDVREPILRNRSQLDVIEICAQHDVIFFLNIE